MQYLCNLYLLFVSIFCVNNLSVGQKNLYPNRTITSSRSIYELVQLRRMAARIAALANRTRQNVSNNNGLMPSWNYTIIPQDGSYLDDSKNKLVYTKETHDRLLTERLTVSFIIGGVSVALVTVVCFICIMIRKSPQTPSLTIEQETPLTTKRRIPEAIPYSQTRFDKRNFQRKDRDAVRRI